MEQSQIQDEAQLRDAIATGRFLLFKHSFRCPISTRAFEAYRAYVTAHTHTRHGWIDVVDQRPLSQQIASQTGVRHESPQALLFEGGDVVWHASHDEITPDALAAEAG